MVVENAFGRLKDRFQYLQSGDTNEGEGGGVGWQWAVSHDPLLFSKQKKKINSFKAETVKWLSPRSKCYYFIRPRAPRIKNPSCQTAMLTGNTFQCSIAPPL